MSQYNYIISRKCYSIGQVKASSTQAFLYCANFIESITFERGPPRTRLTLKYLTIQPVVLCI